MHLLFVLFHIACMLRNAKMLEPHMPSLLIFCNECFFTRITFGVFTSAGSILTEIEKSMILNEFFRIEIETKSIFHDSLKSYKIEIEENWLSENLMKSKSNLKIVINRQFWSVAIFADLFETGKFLTLAADRNFEFQMTDIWLKNP